MHLRSFLPLLALLLLPALARAGQNPDFENDAKPILARQPGLIEYIHAHFEVKESGIARIPGADDAPPQPPFIFAARPRGHSGPFYLRLLIQPGPPGYIMKVADIRRLPPGALPPGEGSATAPPEVANEAPPAPAPAAPASETIGSSAPATSSGSPATADTPSGPVRN
jgi:hypothetical protein